MEHNLYKASKSLYIKEPVDNLLKELKGIDQNIILTGPKHGGKTTVASHFIDENKSNNNEYVFFNNCLTSFDVSDFDEQELIHVIELNIFNYLFKSFDADIKDQFFISVANLKRKFDDYFRGKAVGTDMNIKFLEFGELSKKAIALLRAKGKTVKVVFDRLDGIKNVTMQKVLLQYVKLFDQGIIVIDDDTLANNEDKFVALGYKTVHVDYGKDSLFVKNYINGLYDNYRNYVKGNAEAPSDLDHLLPSNMNLSDCIGQSNIERIINISKGDISLITGIVNSINHMIYWNNYFGNDKDYDIEQLAFNAIVGK